MIILKENFKIEYQSITRGLKKKAKQLKWCSNNVSGRTLCNICIKSEKHKTGQVIL